MDPRTPESGESDLSSNPTLAPESGELQTLLGAGLPRDPGPSGLSWAPAGETLDLLGHSDLKRPSLAPTAPEQETRPTRTTVLPRAELGPGGVELRLQQLPRFEARGRLGAGGVGEVEAAQDNDIGRVVALKRLRPQMSGRQGLLRFVDEIRIVGRLEHPNIIPIHDVGLDEQGRYYFVMKHVNGEALDAILRRLQAGDRATHLKYGFERRVELFRGILQAIEFAHSQGILHRDIKPSNVMVGEHGEVVVLDWGLARPVHQAPVDDDSSRDPVEPPSVSQGPVSERGFQTLAGSVVGTPMYMSPEQAQGLPLDERSDIYALSVLFYELLSLSHPLSSCASVEEILQGVVDKGFPFFSIPKSPHQPVLPMDLVWYVKKGLEKDPSQRYASVREMLDRLDLRAEGKVPIQCHVTLSQRVGREILGFSTRHPIFLALVFLVGIVALIVGVALGIRNL